jgi:Multisubunit Na+/H+ antiporter, MnhC subunit
MELMMAALIGLMTAVSAYLMMSGNLVRFLIGLSALSNAVNLAIFETGRLSFAAPPLIAAGETAPTGAVANALPQALILTAIVIGFGLLAFTLVLVYRIYGAFGTVEIDDIDAAEPRD